MSGALGHTLVCDCGAIPKILCVSTEKKGEFNKFKQTLSFNFILIQGIPKVDIVGNSVQESFI